MNLLTKLTIICAGLISGAAPVSAGIEPYGPGRTADFSWISGKDASGYVISGTLATNQSLYYRSSLTVPLSTTGDVYFGGGFVNTGTLNGTATVAYALLKTITLKGWVDFDDSTHYVIVGTVSGTPSIGYGSGHAIDLKDNTPVSFINSKISTGYPNTNQQLRYMWDTFWGVYGDASFKAGTEVAFDSTNNLVIGGTIYPASNVFYVAGVDWIDYVSLAADTYATFGVTTPGVGPGTFVSSGTLSTPQNVNYYADSVNVIFRYAYLKDFVYFYDNTGVYIGTSASAQSLPTSTGSYSASNNEALQFDGVFVAP